MRAEEIQKLIEKGLQPCTASVTSPDDIHFSATVISPLFANKNRIQKQQLVYATLGKHINDGTIHAISLKTFTPDEWHQQQA